MERILILPERKEKVDGKKRTIQKGRVFFAGEESDFHTEYGIVQKKDLKNSGLVETSQGKYMHNVPASFADCWKRMARGPQVPLLKDIGCVIAETGMNKDSVVVDAGGGSGGTACFFAHITGSVSTYEIREDHVRIINENKKKLGVELTVHYADVSLGIMEKNVDLVFLDLPRPGDAVNAVSDALKPGGFVVGYVPTTVQMSEFVKSLDGFFVTKKIELIERPWKVEEDAVRPVSMGVQHSGFLVFARKL